MYSQCPYCELNSAGQHQQNCPNYTTGTKDNNQKLEYFPIWMPPNKETEIIDRLDKVIDLLEELIRFLKTGER